MTQSLKTAITDRILPNVQSPGQYVGAEWNMVRKNPVSAALRVCLAFPDTYAVGMSHTGLQVLYGVLNAREDVYTERAFAPWTDMRRQLVASGLPLYSLETFTPLREFDMIGFSLQYEMCYTNVLDMLALGGVPILAAERGPRDPLVVAGGPCALNPEPMADFIDVFVLGDGEERVSDMADACIALKHDQPPTREAMLCEIAQRVPNTYAPSLYRVDGSGAVRPREDLPFTPPERIEAAIVDDLDGAYIPERPIVPFVEVVHDRITIEIMRGCTRGCRFCNAGMCRRPLRFRSVDRIVAAAEAQYAATGHSQIGLTSLSSSDYRDLPGLAGDLARRFSPRGVSVSLPSLRVNEQLRDIPAILGTVRKSALTVAPEAATERLRRVINKDISENDLFAGLRAAYEKGWQHVKLYFMVGLPTETDEDVLAIARLAREASRLRRDVARSPARVNLSVAPFVPKPHTPFQWEPMAPLERITEIRSLLLANIRSKSVRLKFHRPERSFLEGMFSRGDRRLGRVLFEAHRLGCRLDAWDECFNMRLWGEAFAKADIAPEDYAYRRFDSGDLLPWSHVGPGVSEAFLRREYEAAERGETTEDCRTGACHDCGIPDCPNRTAAVR